MTKLSLDQPFLKAMCGFFLFQTGDRILEVDGVDLRTASHDRAVQVIRAAGDPVSFLVQSFVQWVSITLSEVCGTTEEAGHSK